MDMAAQSSSSPKSSHIWFAAKRPMFIHSVSSTYKESVKLCSLHLKEKEKSEGKMDQSLGLWRLPQGCGAGLYHAGYDVGSCVPCP